MGFEHVAVNHPKLKNKVHFYGKKHDFNSFYLKFEKNAGTFMVKRVREKKVYEPLTHAYLRSLNFKDRSVYGATLATDKSRNFHQIVPKPTKGTSLKLRLSVYQI